MLPERERVVNESRSRKQRESVVGERESLMRAGAENKERECRPTERESMRERWEVSSGK